MASTKSQQAAIECDEHLLLFAGPGSGKTSTSILKAGRVLQNPDRRLILCTFTVEAAQELNHRLEAHFKKSGGTLPADRVQISTLDALCLRHLKAHRPVKLLPPTAQFPMLMSIAIEHRLPPLEELTPYLEQYQSTLDRDTLRSTLEKDCPEAIVLINEYIGRLRSAGLVDLSIVKLTCAFALRDGTLPLLAVKGLPCTDFLIDEVQDSDELQMMIARVMADSGATTTLVGDDDQTIYAWRSACGYKGMKAFAEHTGARVIRLGENFRSHSEIVDCAVRLIAYNNPDRVDKQQRSMKGPDGSVVCASCATLEKEAEWVTHMIEEEIHRLDGKVLSCAVLARRNRSLDQVEASLGSAGIPYHRAGASFWSKPEVLAYVGLLRLAMNGAVEGLIHVLNMLPIEQGDTKLFLDQFTRNQEAFLSGDTSGFSFNSPKTAKIAQAIAEAVPRWRSHLADGWISQVISDAADGLVLWAKGVSNLESASEDEEPKSMKRLRTMTEIAANALEKENGSLGKRVDRALDARSKTQTPGAVRLLTMHGSKGLEFDSVYLVDCAERDEDSSMTEGPDERRVMYVAMTRARKNLRISYTGPVPVFLQEAGLTRDHIVVASDVPDVVSTMAPVT